MKRYLLFKLLLIFVLVGCAPNPANELMATPEIIAVERDETSDQPTIIATATPIEIQRDALWLRIDAPADDEIVSTPDIVIQGEATPETILTVNDEFILVPANGEFEIPITLEEGSNLLEIIASNYAGEEISLFISISYEP